MTRYFVTSSSQFSFGGPLGAPATIVSARIYVDGVLKAVVGIGNGITGIESPPGTYTYHIVDKELIFSATPVPGIVSIEWYAQDGGNTNSDTYPTLTAPSLDTVASANTIGLINTIPSNGATGVSTRNAMQLHFDADIDKDNLRTDLITLRRKGTSMTVPVSAYVDPNSSDQLIVKPKSDLGPTTTYELNINNLAIYSISGMRMGGNLLLTFTTGDDDFVSVTEATSKGVVDRVAPIILANAGVVPVPTVTLIGANVDGTVYNFNSTTISLDFSEDLDPLVIPTVGIEMESFTGLNEHYHINEMLLGPNASPPVPGVLNIDIVDNTLTIEFDSTFPGNAIVTLTVSGLETAATNAPIEEVSVEFTTVLWPMRVGVAEILRLTQNYTAEDLEHHVIAKAITQAGLDLFFIFGNKAIPQQRCVIKHQVAMEIMDDWLWAQGGGMSVGKTLGAFSSRSGLGRVLPPTYKRLADQLESCWRQLKSYFTRGRHTIKGITSPLERPNYRIRVWRESRRNISPSESSNSAANRKDKMPGPYDKWS